MKITSPIVAGDGSVEIVCEFTTDINLINATGEFNLSEKNYVNKITKSAVITEDAGINYITALITKEESAAFNGTYYYDFTITDLSGNVATIRDSGLPGTESFTKNLKG